jgi:hypothetical protein
MKQSQPWYDSFDDRWALDWKDSIHTVVQRVVLGLEDHVYGCRSQCSILWSLCMSLAAETLYLSTEDIVWTARVAYTLRKGEYGLR